MNFNKSLRLFLLALIISTTSITVAVVLLSMFAANRLEMANIVSIALVLMIQGWYLLFLNENLDTVLGLIYLRLNSIQARNIHHKIHILFMIESLGSTIKLLAISHMDEEPCTLLQLHRYL